MRPLTEEAQQTLPKSVDNTVATVGDLVLAKGANLCSAEQTCGFPPNFSAKQKCGGSAPANARKTKSCKPTTGSGSEPNPFKRHGQHARREETSSARSNFETPRRDA